MTQYANWEESSFFQGRSPELVDHSRYQVTQSRYKSQFFICEGYVCIPP